LDVDSTDKEELGKLTTNIKKQLQRDSTSLNLYLRIITEHPNNKGLKLGTIVPKFVEHNCLSEELNEAIRGISLALDED